MPEDFSNGYDAVAQEFIAVRSDSGRDIVKQWAASLPRGSSVLDIGAGSGEPLTSALIEAGLSVSAIDASANMVAAFRRRFPDINIACEPVEQSTFFDRKFDAVMAVGVIFLLPAKTQIEVISQISGALKSGGRFLFSAPIETGDWNDLLTGRPSISLGVEAYKSALSKCGLHLVNTYNDEGGSHYYDAQKAT